MKYSKPEIFELGDANVLIQGNRALGIHENAMPPSTAGSYEVDE